MEPTFRLADPSDVDRLIDYMRQLYAQDGTLFDEPDARRALEGIVRDRSLGRVWMIGDGRYTFGYVVLTLGYSLEYRGRDAFIDELFIEPGRRRQGFGSRALRFVEGACRELGVRALHLEMERRNAAAHALYRKHGFIDHDRYLMTRRIEDR